MGGVERQGGVDGGDRGECRRGDSAGAPECQAAAPRTQGLLLPLIPLVALSPQGLVVEPQTTEAVRLASLPST